jgi:cell division initiation protein
MRITPLDIRKQEFRKTMRGLDADEVYAFLTTVAEEYEAVLSDNKKLRERIVDLEQRLQEYKKIETNLRNTLLTAERVTNETRENARREASLIVREAEVDAEKAAEAIRAHTQELRREVLELKRQKDNYLTRFRTLLESHSRVLDGFQEDFANIDKEIEEIGQQVEDDLNKGVPTPRMSRQKITEEFGHAPKDKVTWGDEQKREEAPRPGMPKQDAGDSTSTEEASMPSESASGGSPQVSEAQTSLLTDQEEGYSPNHIDVEPVGSMDTAPTDGNPPVPGSTAGPVAAEVTTKADAPAPTERNSEEVRRSVARSIEEQLYPETGKESDGAEAPGGAEEPVAGMQPEQPVAPAANQQDEWKRYDIGGEKPDWKDYDIESAGKSEPEAKAWEPPKVEQPAPADEQKPPADKHVVADDSEVEEALSGLKEVSDQVELSTEDVVTLEKKAPKKGPEPPKAEQPAVGPTKSEDPEWSMEQLRKNLSNLNRDE